MMRRTPRDRDGGVVTFCRSDIQSLLSQPHLDSPVYQEAAQLYAYIYTIQVEQERIRRKS